MNMVAECTITVPSALTERERLAGGKEGKGYKVRETADRGVLGWVEWKICGDREQYGRR